MSHRKNRKLTLITALVASMMTAGLSQVGVTAQEFIRPEAGDAAYLEEYILVEQYFPTVDAAVEYGRENFNPGIHENFHVTMDENGAYLYYETRENAPEPEIPEEPEFPETPEDEIYVVAAGDSLYSIAQRYGITTYDLIAWNNLSNYTLQIGQELKITPPDFGNPEEPEEPEEPSEPEQPSDTIYVVQAGDYLYRIANRFGVSVQDLIDWNNLENDFLQVGDELIVVDPDDEEDEEPEEPSEPEQPSDTIYVVQAGDYLYLIANQFGISVQDLIDWNNLDTNYLYVGQELIVVNPADDDETEEPEDPEEIIYTVQAGDYLYRIANQFGVTVQDIINWNNLENDFLQIGDQLIIRQ